MRTFALALCFGLLTTGRVAATGYQDFNDGVAAFNREDSATTVTYLTAALGEADLPAHLRGVAYHDRGSAYLAAGQLDAAIADFTAAIRLKPNDIQSYISRAAAYEHKHQFAEAVADHSAAMRINPWFLRERVWRYVDELKLMQWDAAVSDIGALIARWPKEPDLYVLRAGVYRVQGRPDLAIADATRAIELDASLATAYAERGWDYEVHDEPDAALGDFETRVKRKPDAKGYFLLGQFQWDMRKDAEAAQSFREALKADPSERYAFIWLVIAGANAPVDTTIVNKMATLDGADWPGPLVHLYLQKGTPDQMAKPPAQLSPEDAHERLCETNFYVGEWWALRGDAGAAKPLLQDATRNCGPGDIEREAATMSLKRLP